MEEAVATAVVLESPSEIVPAPDLVDRFVLDQLLEGLGRGLPVDRPQLEESPVEPRRQQIGEVAFGGGDGVVAQAEGVGPHREQRVNAVVGQVDRTEEVEAGSLRRCPEVVSGCGVGVASVRVDRGGHGGGVGGERSDEKVEERPFCLVVAGSGEVCVATHDQFGEAARGGFIAKAGEGPTRLLENDQFGVGGRGHVGSVGES